MTARLPGLVSLLVMVPFLLFSAAKLVNVCARWADPETRSRVVTTVAS